MPWFRANMTAWFYEYAKKHMSKHSRVYSAYQLELGQELSSELFNSSECSDHRSKEDFQDE